MTYPAYPIYKDSGVAWLGEVPGHWELMRFKFLLLDGYEGLKIGPFGSQLTSEELVTEGYKVYGQENVINNNFSIGSRFITEDKFSELHVYEIRPGDLLITMMGTSGRAQIVPGNVQQGIMDSHLIRLRTEESVSRDFVRLLIDESPYVRYQVRVLGKGSIMHGLNSSIIKELTFALPEHEEQVEILHFLDRETAKIAALIARQERMIALLGEKRQALIAHAVTKGLRPDAPMKDSGVTWLGEIPAHWEVKPIKHLVSMVSGGTPDKENLAYWNGDIPWASAKDLKVDYLTDTEDHITPVAIAEAAARLLQGQAVLIVVRGMILAHTLPVTINVVPLAINQDLKALMPGSLIELRYLAWQLRGLSRIFLARTDTAGHGTKALRTEDWNDIELALPSLEEQVEVANFLGQKTGAIDTLIAKAQQAIALMREHRTSLIAAAVTGKIDVRGVVAEVEVDEAGMLAGAAR